MKLFDNNEIAIYDKIEIEDLDVIADKLQRGNMVYEEFNNIRLYEYQFRLQIIDLEKTSPVDNLNCDYVDIPIKFGIRKTLENVLAPILKSGEFELKDLLDNNFLRKYSIEKLWHAGVFILGTDIFNPIKIKNAKLPNILVGNLKPKLLSYYLINSEDIIVQSSNKANTRGFCTEIINTKRIELAYRLFSTGTSLYSDESLNKVTDKGFDITFKSHVNSYIEYNILYNKFSKLDEFINRINRNEISVESLPEKYLVSSVIVAIITKNPYNIEKLSSIQLTDEDYNLAVSIDGGVLAFVPEERKTLDICKLAIENEPYAREFVPESLNKLLI